MKINSDETYSDFEIISHEISFTKNSLEFYSVRYQLGCPVLLDRPPGTLIQTPGVC